MGLKKKDFIEIEFTGRIKDGNIFDSNIKKDLEEANLNIEAKPFIFSLGNGMFIKGVDDLWDVSLLKFIKELTEGSIRSNIFELGRRGLLNIDSAGVPMDARLRIEELFRQVERDETDPSMLKRELDRWGLFHEYEDRFLSLFRRGSK